MQLKALTTMPTASIKLPEQLHQWVEMQAHLGGFADSNEYVEQVLREERRRQSMDALEAKLLESLESGPASPMTAGDWKKLKNLARHGASEKK